MTVGVLFKRQHSSRQTEIVRTEVETIDLWCRIGLPFFDTIAHNTEERQAQVLQRTQRVSRMHFVVAWLLSIIAIATKCLEETELLKRTGGILPYIIYYYCYILPSTFRN